MSTQTATASSTAQGGCCGSQSGCGSQSHGHDHGHHGHSHDPAPVQLEAPRQYGYDPACPADAPIRLSEKAAMEIKRFIVEKNVPESCVLRVVVRGGGCSGFEPSLGFDTQVHGEADIITEQFGIRVAMDRKFSMFMQGTTIDYLDGIDRRGFKFDNPNATGSCGCGKSFSV